MPNEDRRSYIVTDESLLNGEPIIRGTKTPVRAIVELWRLGIQPEEIPTHLPHIGLAQVFDALRYYAENQLQINQYIEINRVPEELIHPVLRLENSQHEAICGGLPGRGRISSCWRTAARSGFDVLTAQTTTGSVRQIQFNWRVQQQWKDAW